MALPLHCHPLVISLLSVLKTPYPSQHSMHFALDIQQIEQTCSFQLSWGRQLRLTAKLPYSDVLTTRYQSWQDAYLKFYNTGFRARIEQSGAGTLPEVDWRARLVQAEAALLSEFHFWLSSAELLPMRSAIAKAAVGAETIDDVVDVLLTCDSPLLERLPWETWELGTEFGITKTIRLARSPSTIRAETMQRKRRGRLRILAILGDETGLDFKADREAMQVLAPIADITFVGWQWGQAQPDLKATICRAIADEQGWDILFFAGHSNETDLTGGELVIAPHESLFIQELARPLTIAKDKGLQFAIFNSCNGLSLAHTLIDLGLSQVAIMREPIHNRVAQEFLIGFVNGLANYMDVHTALLTACRSLKLDKSLTYPSAYLIPSLFRHADAILFKPEPVGWRHTLKQLLPTRRSEAIVLAILAGLSLLPVTQALLLEPRLWVQSVYREVTRQLPPITTPPVLLVQIDEQSIRTLNARKINPIDRAFLAKVLDRVQALQPSVIGIDYVLDNPTEEDAPLQASIQRAVQQQRWLVFAAKEGATRETATIAANLASPSAILQGYNNAFPGYIELLPQYQTCEQQCPFAYLLALAQTLHQSPSSKLPTPQPNDATALRTQVIAAANQQAAKNPAIAALLQTHLLPLTTASQNFAQVWLQPITDFSIPPQQVYESITAAQLLQGTRPQTTAPIVLIAAGGYDQAGIDKPGQDNFAVPAAIGHWRQQPRSPLINPQMHPQWFTGAEALSYMVHHILQRRFVIPIPDLWMLGIAAIVGKGTVLFLKRRERVKRRWFMLATAIYGLVGLQLYITPGIVMPWLLPSVLFWIYSLPAMKRKANGSS